MKGAFAMGLKFASIHVYDLNKKMTSDSNLLEYKNNMILSTKLLKDYPNGLPIGGAIVIKYDNAAYIFIDGIDEKYSNLNTSYLLKWQIVKQFI